MILLGGSLLTLYSLMTAHAMDRTVPVYVSAAAVTMLFVLTLGSITGPLVTGIFTAVFDDTAMHWVNLSVMSAYTIFLVFRMHSAEPAARAEQTIHTNLVPTSTGMVPTEKR